MSIAMGSAGFGSERGYADGRATDSSWTALGLIVIGLRSHSTLLDACLPVKRCTSNRDNTLLLLSFQSLKSLGSGSVPEQACPYNLRRDATPPPLLFELALGSSCYNGVKPRSSLSEIVSVW